MQELEHPEVNSPVITPRVIRPLGYVEMNEVGKRKSEAKSIQVRQSASVTRKKGARFLYCCGPGEEPTYGSPGFSRVVYANDPERHAMEGPRYGSNYVSTTKYSVISFIPKSLFEQFRRAANLYFLLIACLSLTPLSPFKTPVSQILPLVMVVGLDIAREALEDWRRHQADVELNSRKVKVHVGHCEFVEKRWQDVRVGDTVIVEKDEYFPADLLLLSSTYPDGICYVETMNLDGETNLKLRKSLAATAYLKGDSEGNPNPQLANFQATIQCEDPNPSLYTFIGNMELKGQTIAISPQQILLRGSKLRNTSRIYGVAIFTGFDTKIMKNATDPPSKRSRIEKKMDTIILMLFLFLTALTTVSGAVFAWLTAKSDNQWYLRADAASTYFDPRKPILAGFFQGITSIMLYASLIPISLYVSIAMVKVVQAMFMNWDLDMYYEPTDQPARARTSNLNEELGMVETILSDKTGTLTRNQMDFMKCSIAGVPYGRGVTEVEIAVAKRMGRPVAVKEDAQSSGPKVKGFNLQDPQLLNGNWMKLPNREEIRHFFQIMAVCHTVVPEVDEVTGVIKYEAESPDESAFVITARELGFALFRRSQDSVLVREPTKDGRDSEEREYTILEVLEFNSTRKRMSVIVKFPEGNIELMSKGADSVMYERLSPNGKAHAAETKEHLAQYGEAGLRTLAITYRPISAAEYQNWAAVYQEAKTTVGLDRGAKIEAAAELIERDLILLGATAVEDKLQEGVPEAIDKLAQAGLNIWVLTGDKVETAINIGYAASLLRSSMVQIVMALDDPEIQVAEESGDLERVVELSERCVFDQLTRGINLIRTEKSADAVFALIVDGKSLSFILDMVEVRTKFLALAVSCASVICCRVSPRQKAQVTELVKEGTGQVTLGIGDGANDVGMIQAADIGVGISGMEGMQAVMASDFAIGQFQYLQHLVLKHGHWNYKRISFMICYFFYKNIAFGLTGFYYNAMQQFSGARIYDDWYITLYNVIFTSLPVVVVGMFDQDVCKKALLQYPSLYREGSKNLFFSWARLLLWFANGLYMSLVVSVVVYGTYLVQSFRSDGKVAEVPGVGFTLFGVVILTVNFQIAASINYWTWLQHVTIWGSILVFYVFSYVYGDLPYVISTAAHKVLVEVAGPVPMTWLISILGSAAGLLPYLIFYSFQRRFFPFDSQVIQEMGSKLEKRALKEAWPDERRKEHRRMSLANTLERSMYRVHSNLSRKEDSRARCQPKKSMSFEPERDHDGTQAWKSMSLEPERAYDGSL